jgi:hypothetical protein
MPPRPNPWQGLDEAALTNAAFIPPTAHAQSGRATTQVEVLHLTFIPAFAVEPAGSTAKAGVRLLLRFHYDHNLRLEYHP